MSYTNSSSYNEDSSADNYSYYYYDDNPNFFGEVVTVDNKTYCWDNQLDGYTWCPIEDVYAVPLSKTFISTQVCKASLLG